MFEHSLYDVEPEAAPTGEGDMFHNYELKNWEFSPRLYKILAIAGAANILAILIVAQTSLLTMKGCDSPLVGRVCQVLDTVYVGAVLFGTDREYVDAAYQKTELEDADITFVDVSGETPPLSYPAGYFQVANPDEYQQLLAQANDPNFASGLPPGITTTPLSGNSLIDTPQVVPKKNNDVIDGDLPTFDSSTPSTSGKNGRGKGTTPTDGTTAENKTPEPTPTPLSSDTVNSVEINKKPLADFADSVSAKWSANEVDLSQDFTLTLTAVITADGRLDKTKSKFDPKKSSGDPKILDVGKAALEALGDSGYLTYLKLAGIDQITATLVQDDEQIRVVISSTQKTVERANTVSGMVSFAIMTGKIKAANPSDERTLLDGAKTTTDGKNFLLNFSIPKPIAQEMITRKLKEAQTKKTQPQPNGNAIIKPANNTGK